MVLVYMVLHRSHQDYTPVMLAYIYIYIDQHQPDPSWDIVKALNKCGHFGQSSSRSEEIKWSLWPSIAGPLIEHRIYHCWSDVTTQVGQLWVRQTIFLGELEDLIHMMPAADFKAIAVGDARWGWPVGPAGWPGRNPASLGGIRVGLGSQKTW